MRFAAAIAVLVLALTPGFAQDPASVAQPSAPKPQDLCTLERVVVKATTGEGLKKIEVTVISRSTSSY
jgi:hypothetical protein